MTTSEPTSNLWYAVRVCRQCDRSYTRADHGMRSPKNTAQLYICPRCAVWHSYCTRCNQARLNSEFAARHKTLCKPCRNDRLKTGRYLQCKRCNIEFRGQLKWARDAICHGCKETHKYCPSCDTSKPHDDFYATKLVKDGRQGFCIQCILQRTRAGGKNHAARLKREYGLTEVDYRYMLQVQDGKCAICKEPEQWMQSNSEAHSRGLAIDHCHETGTVRGLLCTRCNWSIGQFKDDPNLLRAAAVYIESHRLPQLSLAS